MSNNTKECGHSSGIVSELTKLVFDSDPVSFCWTIQNYWMDLPDTSIFFLDHLRNLSKLFWILKCIFVSTKAACVHCTKTRQQKKIYFVFYVEHSFV